MDFSICFPTRERPGLLADLLASLMTNTADIARVEVLIAYDEDDEATGSWVACHGFPFARFHRWPRASNFSREYYNRLASMSSGRYLIALNDDTIFATPGWDKVALSALTQYRATRADGILYGWVDDSLRHESGFSCFPLVSREAYEALGWLLPEELPTWGADIEVWALFREIDRICRIEEVLIDHISHHTGKRPVDAVNENSGRLDRRAAYKREDWVARLRERMATGHQ